MTSNKFILTSNDIAEGHAMSSKHEANLFGCEGENLSPHLAWKNAPAGTKSFAITMFDPDAPTGSGFWHWIAVDIPANINQIPTGASGNFKHMKEIKNDYGIHSYGGACPPKDHGLHRYVFTIWALPVENLDYDDTTSHAIIRFNLNHLALDKASITTTFMR